MAIILSATPTNAPLQLLLYLRMILPISVLQPVLMAFSDNLTVVSVFKFAQSLSICSLIKFQNDVWQIVHQIPTLIPQSANV